ncbi:hypothetical protein E2C01_011740 [Portunus trituberculatus]|uniref:Uncharacterized protein n=1 Tax=Portunus trituberculatus TaxID=210409 RepID=A0A5B7DCN5_PORTR|nr:hypothetical protein [Portunus trituberculatus]
MKGCLCTTINSEVFIASVGVVAVEEGRTARTHSAALAPAPTTAATTTTSPNTSRAMQTL